MADPKTDTKTDAPKTTEPKTTEPKTVILYTFTSANGGVYHHPTTEVAGKRMRFAPNVETHHELDWWCKSLIEAGCLKIV